MHAIEAFHALRAPYAYRYRFLLRLLAITWAHLRAQNGETPEAYEALPPAAGYLRKTHRILICTTDRREQRLHANAANRAF